MKEKMMLKPSSTSIDEKATALLSKWTVQGHVVYLRPITSRYLYPTKPHRIYWSVSVETYESEQYRAEGLDLSKAILELADQVPRPKSGRRKKGWLNPT